MGQGQPLTLRALGLRADDSPRLDRRIASPLATVNPPGIIWPRRLGLTIRERRRDTPRLDRTLSIAPKRVGGWSTLILLISMLLTCAFTLVATEWTDHLDIVPLVGIGGLLVGVLLAASSFPDWLTHVFSLSYGLTWTTFLVGTTLPDDLVWTDRIYALANRVSTWVYQAFTGGTGQDSLIFLVLLSALSWILAYNAAWNTYRHTRPWIAALPFGVVSVVITHYYTGSAPLIRYLGFYLVLALLYVGQATVMKREQTWREERVAFDPTLTIGVLRSSFILALSVMIVALALPSTSSPSSSVSDVWQQVNRPWKIIEEEWQRLFSSVHAQRVEVLDPFSSTLTLGGSSSLEETPVMDIKAPDITRYYWRTSIFATYDGRRWSLPNGSVEPLAAGTLADANVDAPSRRTITQTVTNYLPGRQMLVGASQPAAFDREARALVRTSQRSPLEVYRVSSGLPLAAGDQYRVASRISQADAPTLRQSGTDYPDWIVETYLQLPDSLPQRVRDLAAGLTTPADTPYDKARLLEQYLRDTITYDLTPPGLPGGRDYVDFLLFESQRGYCNGYASAMVVMARSVGIPARLASGYAEGEYDPDRGVFRIRENNAHSWPEIYFPDHGWVEFEPTVSEDPLVRSDPDQASEESPEPLADDPSEDPESLDDPEAPPMEDVPEPAMAQTSTAGGSWRPPLLSGLLAVAASAALAAGGWWAAENWGLRRLPTVEQGYGRLLRFGRWLGRPLRGADTPLEWMRDLSTIVPDAREHIARIVELHAVAQFGRGDPKDPEANAAWDRARASLWRHLLWDQWLQRLGLASRQPTTDD